MAEWFFDQNSGGAGTSATDPASISNWAVWFSSFIAPADTVYIIGRVTPGASLTIDDSNVAIRGNYSGYANGIIDAQDTNDYCLHATGKAIVDIQGIAVKNATVNNIRVDSNGASVTSCKIKMVSSTGAGRGYTGNADTTTGTGILLINNNLNNSISGIDITDNVSTDNGKHGFDYRGNCIGVSRRNYAASNGFANTGHGIHTNAPLIEVLQGNWSQVAATAVYECTQNLFGYIPEDVNINVADDDRRWLSSAGDTTTPGVNQWSYFTSTNTLYINIDGDNPANATASIKVFMASNSNMLFEEDVAEYNIDVDGIEGMGFSFDNGFKNSKISRCISRYNEGDGISFFNARDCLAHGNLIYDNGRNGINFISIVRDSDLTHNSCIDNGMSGYWFPRSVNPTVLNNLSLRNGVNAADTSGFRLDSLQTTGLVEGGNISYQSGTNGANNFTNMTGSADNPLLYPNFHPEPLSPCIRAGVTIDAFHRVGNDGRGFRRVKPTIGAFEQRFV